MAIVNRHSRLTDYCWQLHWDPLLPMIAGSTAAEALCFRWSVRLSVRPSFIRPLIKGLLNERGLKSVNVAATGPIFSHALRHPTQVQLPPKTRVHFCRCCISVESLFNGMYSQRTKLMPSITLFYIDRLIVTRSHYHGIPMGIGLIAVEEFLIPNADLWSESMMRNYLPRQP